MGPKPTNKKTLSKICCVSLCKLLFHITLEMQIVLLVVEIKNFPCTVLQENVCRKLGWGGMVRKKCFVQNINNCIECMGRCGEIQMGSKG